MEIYNSAHIQALVTTHTNHIITCNLDDLFFITNDENANELVLKLAKECNTISSNTASVIGYMVNEPYNISYWKQYVELFNSKLRGSRSLILILNSHYVNYSFSFNVVYIDFYLMRTWFKSNSKHSNQNVNTKWNYKSETFLCLLGKIDKVHRLGLLYKLSTNGILDKCKWSMHVPTHLNEYTIKQAIPQLSLDDIEEFITLHKHSLDTIAPTSNNSTIFDYSGFPYNPNEYSNTAFRLISETFIERNDSESIPWITEKTWISILNHHPFIMVGEKGTLELLQSKGFKTFNEYLPIPDYDTISNVNEKLNACVSNTINFFDVIHSHKEQIQNDIEHNINNFEKIVKKNESVMRNVANEVGLGGEFDVYKIIPIFH